MILRPGSPATVLVGCSVWVGRGGSESLEAGSREDALRDGGLAVEPLLFVNFKSEILTLRSLFTDLRLQISDRGDEEFAEVVLDVEFV